MRGGIAERGGVRVGHRIIEINGQSVVATAHEKIVQALSNSVGEVKLMHTNISQKPSTKKAIIFRHKHLLIQCKYCDGFSTTTVFFLLLAE